MKFSRLLAVVSLLSFGASLAIAQDSIRLKFEVVKDGATLARPEVSVTAGSTGTLEVADVGHLAFTPTLRGSDGISLVFIGVHVKYGEIPPIIMSGVLGLLMAFIAYGRLVLKPIF